jgi:hypothetical protein
MVECFGVPNVRSVSRIVSRSRPDYTSSGAESHPGNSNRIFIRRQASTQSVLDQNLAYTAIPLRILSTFPASILGSS